MYQYAVAVLFLFCFTPCDGQGSESNDMMVFLRTRGRVDVRRLKSLPNTVAVYKVKNVPFPSPVPRAIPTWNYAVVGRDFQNSNEERTYINNIKYFNFVEETQEYKFQGHSKQTVEYVNNIVKLAKDIGETFGILEERPLKANVPQYVQCNTIDTPPSSPMFTITLLKVKEESSFIQFVKTGIYKIMTVLNMEYTMGGDVQSSYWEKLGVDKYDSRKTYCEYMESQLIMEFKSQFDAGVSDMESYTALQM